MTAGVLDGVGQLVGHPVGHRAAPAGVGEDVHGGKIGCFDHSQGFRKLLLCLACKAADQVGGDGGPVKILTQQTAALQKSLRRVLSVHPFQGGIAARLEGQMEVGAEVGQGRRPTAEILGDGAGLQTAQPHPQGGDGMAESFQQVDEGDIPFQILSPAGDFDAGENDLVVPCLGKRLGLGHSGVNGFAAHRPTGEGDDAVGTEVAAPVLHLEHGPGPPLQPPGGEGLKDPAAEGIIQGHRLLPGACQLLQQVQKSPPVSAAAAATHSGSRTLARKDSSGCCWQTCVLERAAVWTITSGRSAVMKRRTAVSSAVRRKSGGKAESSNRPRHISRMRAPTKPPAPVTRIFFIGSSPHRTRNSSSTKTTAQQATDT